MRKDKKIDIKYIANLARINLTEEEARIFAAQLDTIITYIEKLNQVDTKDTPATTHPLPIINVFRDDAVKESLPAEETLKNAPDRKDGFFKVPRIIEGE